MKSAVFAAAAAVALLTAAPALAWADKPPEKLAGAPAPKAVDPVAGLTRQDGLLPTYVDRDGRRTGRGP